jgi:phage gpG-like protein
MGHGPAGGTRTDLIRAEVNAAAVLERFRVLVNESKDRRVPNRQLSVQLQGWVLRNFQQGGSLQTPSWAPLKPSTAKEKARKGYSSKPLERTGHLRQSFRPFYDNDMAGVGSEVPYSQYHETGTATLPQRAMLPSASVALEYARTIYERWAAGLAKSA